MKDAVVELFVYIAFIQETNYKLIQRHFKNEITKTLGNIKNIENTLSLQNFNNLPF